jgi:hypothetical protein
VGLALERGEHRFGIGIIVLKQGACLLGKCEATIASSFSVPGRSSVGLMMAASDAGPLTAAMFATLPVHQGPARR